MAGRYEILNSAIPAYSGAADPNSFMALAGAALPPADAQAAIARALANNAVIVQDQVGGRPRLYPLGFDSGATIAAGVQQTINSQPQLPFRLERLVVPSDIAGSFTIDDIVVGKNSQFANENAVPARVFDERADGVRLKGDTAQTSQNVTLKVTNISGAPVRFRAAIMGTAIDS